MRIHWNSTLVVLGVACIGCGTPDVAPPEVQPVGAGMPMLERRPFQVAESDLPEGRFMSFDVASGGRVVYAASNEDSPKFRVLDSTGIRLAAFGRSGEGPGETRNVVRVEVRNDTIRVHETARFMLVETGMDGRFLQERRVPGYGIALAWFRDSIDHWDSHASPGAPMLAQTVYRSSLGGQVGRRLIGPEDSVLAAAAAKHGINAVLAIPYASNGDQFWIADPWTYSVRKFDAEGALLRAFSPDVPPATMGPRMLAIARDQISRRPKFTRGPKGQAIPLPDESGRLDTLDREQIKHFSRNPLHLDSHGRLWVIGLVRDSTSVDVFADTTWLGRAMLPCYASGYGTRVALGPGWLLLECEVDDGDWPTELQLYRVIEQ